MADFCIHCTKPVWPMIRPWNWPWPRPRSKPAAGHRHRHRLRPRPGYKVAKKRRPFTPRSWKFDNAELAYPNAEIVRKLLVNVLPADAIVLIPHDTFGMDLGPGLSIKLDSAYVADVVASKEPTAAPPFWCARNTRYGSTHVSCDIRLRRRDVNVRPAFQAPEAMPPAVRWKTNPAMSATLPPTAGSWKWWKPKWAMWTSPKKTCWSPWAAASKTRTTGDRPGTGRGHGRRGFLLAPHRGRQMAGKIPPGGHLGPDRQAQGLSGLRHQRLISSIWAGSRALLLSWPSTRIPRPPSFRWPTWASKKTSSTFMPELTESQAAGCRYPAALLLYWYISGH
jgi:hypothetical protein